jgi:predicted HicB family RNase H-like nuclease
MKNIMIINDYKAKIDFDPEIAMFRGEFIGLNGGADFYAKSIDELRIEGQISLNVFLDICREKNIEPRKEYSGKFNLRVDPAIHKRLVEEATSNGKSLNQTVSEILESSLSLK